jgi:hypothetical protein
MAGQGYVNLDNPKYLQDFIQASRDKPLRMNGPQTAATKITETAPADGGLDDQSRPAKSEKITSYTHATASRIPGADGTPLKPVQAEVCLLP